MLINLFLFFVSFFYLWFSRPNGVGLEDSGGFFISACNFGISHPPGYPLFNLLGSVTHLIFKSFFSCIESILLFNIIISSFSILLLYNSILYIFIKQDKKFSIIISFLSSLFLLVSRSFSFLARSSEVYSLHLFFVILLIFILLKISIQRKNKDIGLFFFALGLSVSNHYPLLVLLFPFLVTYIYFLKIEKEIFNNLIHNLLFFCLGITPYLFYFINPYVSDYYFYSQVSSISDAINLFLRKDQFINDALPTWEIKDSLYFSFSFIERVIGEFGIFVSAIGLIGILFYFPFLILTLSIPVLLPWFWRTEVNQFTLEMFQYWELSSYLGIVFGVSILFNKLIQLDTLNLNIKKAIYLLVFLLCISCILSSAKNQFQLKEDTLANDYGKLVLESLPENSILFVHKDTEAGIIGFENYVNEIRKDILVISQVSALLPKRVFLRKTNPTRESQRIPILNFITKEIQNGKRIFTTRKLEQFDEKIVFPMMYTHYGLYFEITEDKKEFKIPYNTMKNIISTLTKENLRIEKNLDQSFFYSSFQYPWRRYREFLTRDLCHTILLNEESISGLENLSECMFTNAQWEHVSLKNYEFADELFRISLPKTNYLYKSEKAERYKDFLINRVSFANSIEDTIENKRKWIIDGINQAKKIALNFKSCDNKLTKLILKLNKELKIEDKEIEYQSSHCK